MISLTLEETVWAGSLISFARWTENDHCECNKAFTCLPEKTTLGSPPCFELEKRQVKNPPVSPTQSLMWSHPTPHLCSVPTCKIICMGHGPGLKTFSYQRPRDVLQGEHCLPFDKVLSSDTTFLLFIGPTWGKITVWKWRRPISKSLCKVYYNTNLGFSQISK